MEKPASERSPSLRPMNRATTKS